MASCHVSNCLDTLDWQCTYNQSVNVVISWLHQTPDSLAGKYMAFPVRVSISRRISHRLLSNVLLDPIAVLQPTPLCQMEKETLLFAVGSRGIVKSAKKSKSSNVSINSSARGLTSSYSSARGDLASWLSSGCASSKRTSPAICDCLVLLFRRAQKKLSSHSSRCSAS